MPRSVRKLLKERKGLAPDEEEEEEDDLEDIDRITKEEAYLFPIFGSITLLGLFLAFKYLDKVCLLSPGSIALHIYIVQPPTAHHQPHTIVVFRFAGYSRSSQGK